MFKYWKILWVGVGILLLAGCDSLKTFMSKDLEEEDFRGDIFAHVKGELKGCNDLLCLMAGILGRHFPDALLARGADDHFLLIDVFPGEEELSRLRSEINMKS